MAEDRGNEIIKKRMNLLNLVDQANSKQRDLNHLNQEIEKEKRELRLVEKILKVDRAVEELENYPRDFKKGIKTWHRAKLKSLYSDMDDEEIDMLYEKIRIMEW